MLKHKKPRRPRRSTPDTVRASAPMVPPAGRSSPRPPESFQSPIARLLEEPHLARLVPHFAPEMLQAVIRHHGLQACGELVAAATPAQLTSVFDTDLWRHRQPGQNEQFDSDRFGEWVETLVETDPTVAARVVADMDPRLVIAGLSRYIRVFDPSAIALPAWTHDDEPAAETTPPGGSECALAGYVVRAVTNDTWDAIVALLTALAAEHPDCFHAVMVGCRQVSDSTPEVDGLDELLTRPEQLLYDIAADREHRRSQQGYSTPADARAFLEGARRQPRVTAAGEPAGNPIAAAYFRAAAETAASAIRDLPMFPARPAEPASAGASLFAAREAVADVLAEAGVVPPRPWALLEGAPPQAPLLARLRPLMDYVRDADDEAHFTRTQELAFLANTLMAGCSLQSRPFTVQEASDAVVGICNLGLEHWPERWPDAATRDTTSTAGGSASLPPAFLVSHDLVTAFEVGWAVLYQDVSLFVTEHLIVTLKGLRCADPDMKRGVAALRAALVRERKARTPWRARGALDVLAMLDMPAWVGLDGLLNECPVLPEAVTATLAGHKGAVSATSFEFISTGAQIEKVGAFMATLPDLLRP